MSRLYHVKKFIHMRQLSSRSRPEDIMRAVLESLFFPLFSIYFIKKIIVIFIFKLWNIWCVENARMRGGT